MAGRKIEGLEAGLPVRGQSGEKQITPRFASLSLSATSTLVERGGGGGVEFGVQKIYQK
jgi:hypothetical protein